MDGPAPRVCLKCDKTFNSKSKGNRICPFCKGDNSKVGKVYIQVLEQSQMKRKYDSRRGTNLDNPHYGQGGTVSGG